MNLHLLHAHARMMNDASADPTGTGRLRRQWKADFGRRWGAVTKLLRQALIENDMFGLAGATAANILTIQSGDRALTFQLWFDEVLRQTVFGQDGSWTRPYIREAYAQGFKRATRLSRTEVPPDYTNINVLSRQAIVELQGIMEAVSQQVVRIYSDALLAHARPSQTFLKINDRLRAIGRVRSNALAEFQTVKSFNTATLDQFRMAGLTHVSLLPESVPVIRARDFATAWEDAKKKVSKKKSPKKSRRKAVPSARTIRRIKAGARKVEEFEAVNILTAGDFKVCPECIEIADGGPYDVNEAQGMIPAHPNCRCAFVPAYDLRFKGDIHVIDVFDPAKHPRHPAGSEKGGEFAHKWGPPGAINKMGLVELMDRRRDIEKKYKAEKDPTKKAALKENLKALLEEQHKQYMAKGNMKAAAKVEHHMGKYGWSPTNPMKFIHTPSGATVGVNTQKPELTKQQIPVKAASPPAPPPLPSVVTKTPEEWEAEQMAAKAAKEGLSIGEYKAKYGYKMSMSEAEWAKSQQKVPGITKAAAETYWQQYHAKKKAAAEGMAYHAQQAAVVEAQKEAKLTSQYNAQEKEAFGRLKALVGNSSQAGAYIDHGRNKAGKSGYTDVNSGDIATVAAYTSSYYKPINYQLRQGQMDEHIWENTKALNTALDKMPIAKGTFYRKANLPPDIAALYKPGKIVEERGFTSTSMNSGTWSGDYRYTIHGKTGRRISGISMHPSEAEVLFKSGTRFKVLKVSGKMIEMEEVE